MKLLLSKLLGRVADLVDLQPVLALFIAGALLTVFLTSLLSHRTVPDAEGRPTLLWTLYRHLLRLAWSVALVAFLTGTLVLIRVYLHQAVAGFQRTHGRVTEANFNAIQTIWGAPQEQRELTYDLYWQEEVTERIESEDLTKPAVLRKKTVRHDLTANPFISGRHQVELRQNPRRKGSALYGGYETVCRFEWKLINPADRDLSSLLKFPLPSATGMYADLTATLNGRDVLPQIQLKDGALLLAREVKAHEADELAISFKSRGMSYWYFQVQEPREIRDFTLVLSLPDLTKEHLNFPEGCMTPTDIKAFANHRGTTLTFRLDHAISNKGMGIALPTVTQPGETTNAVLGEAERAWLLIFAMLILGLTLASAPQPILASVFFGAAAACGYGLLGDCSDLLFGFWGTAGLVLVPGFGILAWLLTCLGRGATARVATCRQPSRLLNLPTAEFQTHAQPADMRHGSKWLGLQLILFGLVYPCAAGLDPVRQPLYLDLAALFFLTMAAWQFISRLRAPQGAADKSVLEPLPSAT